MGGRWLVVVVRGRDKWGGVCNETCVCGGLSVRRKGKCEILGGNRQFDLMYFTQTCPDLDIFCSSKYTATQTSLKTVLTIMAVSSYTSHGSEKMPHAKFWGENSELRYQHRWVFYSGWVIKLLGSLKTQQILMDVCGSKKTVPNCKGLVHHEIDSQAFIFVDAVSGSRPTKNKDIGELQNLKPCNDP